MINDQQFMKQAIALGQQVFGLTGDNPNVGCIIVKDSKIIGRGKTGIPGKPHAEIDAFLDAEANHHSVNGATLYSTVEPCCFQGRTPACTSTIIKKSISRVVIGIRDPHPKVQGAGIRLLKEAGIEVVEDICKDRVQHYLKEWLNAFKVKLD